MIAARKHLYLFPNPRFFFSLFSPSPLLTMSSESSSQPVFVNAWFLVESAKDVIPCLAAEPPTRDWSYPSPPIELVYLCLNLFTLFLKRRSACFGGRGYPFFSASKERRCDSGYFLPPPNTKSLPSLLPPPLQALRLYIPLSKLSPPTLHNAREAIGCEMLAISPLLLTMPCTFPCGRLLDSFLPGPPLTFPPPHALMISRAAT